MLDMQRRPSQTVSPRSRIGRRWIESRVVIVVLLGLALVGGVWGQSQIPAEDTNFLAVTGNTDNGDTDAYQVVFFQVPKTVTGPLYFAVYDPGVDDAAGTGGPDTDPDQGNTGNWEFRLYGGTGTLTGDQRQRNYTFAGGRHAGHSAWDYNRGSGRCRQHR